MSIHEKVYVRWIDSGASGGTSWATAVHHQEDVRIYEVESIGYIMAEDDTTLWLAMGFVNVEIPIFYNIAAIWKANILKREGLL